jgi:tetratricopeptide (TPR) repeat protein
MSRRPVLPILATLVLAAAASAWGHAGIPALEDAARDEVARQPGDPGAHLHEALVHEVAHEWDAALVALAEAAERGADPDQVAVVRRRVFLAAGWPRMARREFDCLLARRPEAFGALYERGRAWMQLGNPEEVARDFGRAVAGLPRPTPEHVFAHRDALLAAGHREDAVRALDAGMAHVDAPGGTIWSPFAVGGFRYTNGAAAIAGIEVVKIKLGTGTATLLRVKGRGAGLAMPTLPVTLPVMAQLENLDHGACWETVFTTAKKNEAARVIAVKP